MSRHLAKNLPAPITVAHLIATTPATSPIHVSRNLGEQIAEILVDINDQAAGPAFKALAAEVAVAAVLDQAVADARRLAGAEWSYGTWQDRHATTGQAAQR